MWVVVTIVREVCGGQGLQGQAPQSKWCTRAMITMLACQQGEKAFMIEACGMLCCASDTVAPCYGSDCCVLAASVCGCRGDFVIVGDLMKSITLLFYKAAEGALEVSRVHLVCVHSVWSGGLPSTFRHYWQQVVRLAGKKMVRQYVAIRSIGVCAAADVPNACNCPGV